MTIAPSPIASRSNRRRRVPVFVRWLLGIVVIVVVFGLGVAVGQALEDRPRAGKPVTNISTIQPWTQRQP